MPHRCPTAMQRPALLSALCAFFFAIFAVKFFNTDPLE